MTTPIRDFVLKYAGSGASRLHMPGHKGLGPLGFESLDITEVAGADALYEADGIIAESERNVTSLFGTQKTLYSTEGSSQCIRAMLFLAMTNAPKNGSRPIALAARNAHKAFLFAAALCDFDAEWLLPDGDGRSLCSCPVSAESLENALSAMKEQPFCVYVTSPDYLGGRQDVAALAKVAHAHGVPLLVDNAHGAYLKFLPEGGHPIDLGADMCCDSAHKTLPVLTGGAYLHISQNADARFAEGAKRALALFGSTSPSYLILQSLDCANAALAGDFPARLAECTERVAALKQLLADRGFRVLSAEPTKLTLETDGVRLAEILRQGGVECEFADDRHVVMMFSPDTPAVDFEKITDILRAPLPCPPADEAAFPATMRKMSIREAMFAESETVPVCEAEGRICAVPTVSCPPAIPIAISGELITAEVVRAFERYGINKIAVVKNS